VITMNKFDEFKDFTVKILPSNATDKTVEWKSLDSDIVEVVENGKIKGVSTGAAMVEVTSKSNPKKKAIVKVQVGQPLEGIIVPEIKLQKGTSQPIVVHHTPADATNVNETKYFLSENEKYITVSNGVVHGVRVGKTEMTVTVKDDKGKEYKAIVKVTVTPMAEKDSNDKQDKY
ncbi:MAG: Ig-like domain-containing protein, partial [Peribacillus sp.]